MGIGHSPGIQIRPFVLSADEPAGNEKQGFNSNRFLLFKPIVQTIRQGIWIQVAGRLQLPWLRFLLLCR
jgi:hypothetical protein